MTLSCSVYEEIYASSPGDPAVRRNSKTASFSVYKYFMYLPLKFCIRGRTRIQTHIHPHVHRRFRERETHGPLTAYSARRR